METTSEITGAKQYPVIIMQDETLPCDFESYIDAKILHNDNLNLQKIHSDNSYNSCSVESVVNEEHVDLTTFHNSRDQPVQEFKENVNIKNQLIQPPAPIDMLSIPEENGVVTIFPLKRRLKRRLFCRNDGNIILNNNDSIQPNPITFSPSKQFEVLKAAKSLFSKRTRTLYQWMYPNAHKQQIKNAVSSSWESLDKTEKNFYISQVLGRFGLTHSNLMVNPQIDSIKELPKLSPLPEPSIPLLNQVNSMELPSLASIPTSSSFQSIHQSKYISRKCNRQELQTAVSSITPTTVPCSSFEEFEQYSSNHKKRRGRPKANSTLTKKIKVDNGVPQDFYDDPELSQELEKFAIKFNLSKIGL